MGVFSEKDERAVVRVGLVDTFTPSFYIDVYTPLIESLKASLPQYRFVTKEISHADAMKPEVVAHADFVIVSSGGARMLSGAGLQQIATLRRNRSAYVSRSSVRFLSCRPIVPSERLLIFEVAEPQQRRPGHSKAG